MNRPLTILVVDDHAVVRRGTMDIITDMPGECRFVEAASVAEAEAALEAGEFGLAVLDISLPDGSGLKLLERMTRERPDMPVVVLSMHREAEYARRALALGAKGYLSKNSAPEELAEALSLVLEGETYVNPALSHQLSGSGVTRPSSSRLSRQEREVAYRLGRGETLSGVAASMGVSVKTASTYRARIMRKLGLKTTADFFRYTIEKGDFFL
ncbi:MAG: response regulator transcription factor [Desulfovibrio sp.]|nr:response regulator transcription factor [Desulfovibrio sp.]MBI4960472.1 response regulator transcription factor [Desulfovibrio sp.]